MAPERTGKHFICYCNQQIPGTSDYSIAQAAFQHMDHILEVSQETLAEESHLSEASVSRFVHKCGFDTFQKFKQQVAMFLSWRGRRKFQEQLLHITEKPMPTLQHSCVKAPRPICARRYRT